MSTPRIGLVLASSTGGVGQHVASLTRHLVARGIPPVVQADSRAEAVFGFARLGAVLVPLEIPAALHPRQDLEAVGTLRAAAGDLDLLHAHGLRAGLLAVLATRTLRRRPPVVVTWHNAVLPEAAHRRVLAWLEQTVARGATVNLGASSDLVARALALGARDARLAPVAAPTLRPSLRDRATIRRELGVGERTLALVISRIAPQKGLDVLLEATRRLPDDGVVVLVAGDGDPELSRTLIEAADPQRVRFLGRRSDVPDLLAAADLVVLPSRWEARALVAQEALLAGVPLVATAVGGVPELVGDAAVLVAAEDPQALADAIAAVASDPAQAAQLAQAGLARAATWPDEGASAEALLVLYQELTGGLGWQPVD